MRPRRCLILILLLLALAAAHQAVEAIASDPRWLRCVVALYRMVQETGTVSDERSRNRGARAFSGSVERSHRDPPRVTRQDFIRLARGHELAQLTKSDRFTLDRNIWTYVQLAALRAVLHLHEQWGVEGRCLARGRESDVQHVETCRVCRNAFELLTRSTTLGCGSAEIGYQEPEVNSDPDKKVTIPP